MTLEELKTELKEVWVGSGYSCKSLLRTMNSFGFGADRPYTEDFPAVYNCYLTDQNVVVVLSMTGYKILKELC